MKKSIFVLAFLCFSFLVDNCFARELLVLSGDKSKNSKRWQKDVLPEYSTSSQGKTLPAKIVPVKGNLFPEWLAKALDEGRVGEIFGTPTFLIWDPKKEKEIGRIEGYTKKSRFFSQLEEAIHLISQGQHPGKREGSGAHSEGSDGDRRQEEGSGNNSNIMDHIYKTPEEAKQASEALGLGGQIHSHQTPEGTIYMPGTTM